jgi:hypothetical protein
MGEYPVHIKDLETDEIIHTMTVRCPKNTSQYDKFDNGLYRKVDFERFYVDDSEVPES